MSAFTLSRPAPREPASVRFQPNLDVWDVPSPWEHSARPLRVATVPRSFDPWRENLRHRLEHEVAGEATGAAGSSVDWWHDREAAVLRQEVLTEFDAYTYDDVVELYGALTADEMLRAWSQREVIAVPVSGTGRFPGFQLADNRIAPGVAPAVAALEASGLRGWPATLWFTAGNGWLADHRPVDLLAIDPDAVVSAARRRLERAAE
jgi:hypothetical protein